jgi:hypothetical protein
MTVADDLGMLRQLVAKADEIDEMDDEGRYFYDFQERHRKSFRDILDRMENGKLYKLSESQRGYIRGIYERVFQSPVYENLVSEGKVPRGKEVKLLVDAMPKPLKPPGRRM